MVDGVKTGPQAIMFETFDRCSSDATLADYIAYSLKEATRIETIGQFAVLLPFDERTEMGQEALRCINFRQKKVLNILTGPDRFKVYRPSKRTS